MPRKPHREVYEGRTLLLPELRMLGWNSNKAARDTTLDEHTHRDAFEICYIARGSVEWWAGRRTYEVGPGELYVTKPRERHGGVDAVIQPCDLYWLQVAERVEHAPDLVRRLGRLRLRCFPGSSAIRDAFEQLLVMHRLRNRTRLAAHQARAALHTLLVHVIHSHDAQINKDRIDARRLSPEVRRSLEWMEARLSEDFAIAEAAAAARLSASQFHTRFAQEVGYSPGDWRTRQRVREAKRLLRGGDASVTDVAMRCGFATSQYFATVFKNMVGLTPREYRARAAQTNG